ncbi:MAG: hypothetical protein ACJ768_16715 [Gaiellaceae bacterium]
MIVDPCTAVTLQALTAGVAPGEQLMASLVKVGWLVEPFVTVPWDEVPAIETANVSVCTAADVVKTAVAVLSLVIPGSEQVGVAHPLASSSQPLNTQPLLAVAVSVTGCGLWP